VAVGQHRVVVGQAACLPDLLEHFDCGAPPALAVQRKTVEFRHFKNFGHLAIQPFRYRSGLASTAFVKMFRRLVQITPCRLGSGSLRGAKMPRSIGSGIFFGFGFAFFG